MGRPKGSTNKLSVTGLRDLHGLVKKVLVDALNGSEKNLRLEAAKIVAKYIYAETRINENYDISANSVKWPSVTVDQRMRLLNGEDPRVVLEQNQIVN